MPPLGVVGAGSWGRNLLRTFDELGTVRAVCHAGTPETADWLGEHYPHVTRTTEYDDLLASEEIEAIVIATPIPTLAKLTRRALEAGKHVFVEKPMATDSDEARELAALARELDRVLFVGYIFAHHPHLRQAVDPTEDIAHLRLEWTKCGSFGPDLLYNLACHPISIAVHVLTEIDTVEVVETRSVTDGLDVIGVNLEDGTTSCSIRVDRLSPIKQYICRVFSSDGGCEVANDAAHFTFDTAAETFHEDATQEMDPLTTECHRFLEAVDGDEAPVTDGSFGASVLEVLEEIEHEASARRAH